MIATTLSEQSVNYKNLPKYDHFALIMGNEGQGISKTMTEEADVLAHIEMPGQAESLNVAVAAGVVIFSLI
ncbi:FIG011178: rRNA methylase [Streptococcus agalactiae]|nr:FIG011178: rRNA methylase [Streptococcus agalactiae]